MVKEEVAVAPVSVRRVTRGSQRTLSHGASGCKLSNTHPKIRARADMMMPTKHDSRHFACHDLSSHARTDVR